MPRSACPSNRWGTLAIAVAVCVVASPAAAQPSNAPFPGRSDPAFQQPSIAPGVDYTVPSRDEIKVVLDRVLENFVRTSSFEVVDTATGKADHRLHHADQDGRGRHEQGRVQRLLELPLRQWCLPACCR